MRNRSIPVHMAHMPGACALAQTPNGQHLFTSGVDATLRLHDIRPTTPAANNTSWWQSDPPTSEPDLGDISSFDANHSKPITSLALTASGTTLASASADGFVRFFSVSDVNTNNTPKLTFLQSCARFSAPVRCLSFSGSGAFIAAAGEEPGLVKVVMTAQPASINVMRTPSPSSAAHDAIVELAFDAAGDYVATVGERGCAAIWDVEHSCLLSIVDLNGRKAKCVQWAPDDTALVFGTDKGAVIVSKLRWFVDYQLEDVTDADFDDDNDDDDDDDIFGGGGSQQSNGNGKSKKQSKKNCICAVDWSPNGRYVLTSSMDGSVLLWDVVVKKVLGVWKAQEIAQSIRWHYKANSFVIIDQNGQWGIIDSVVPSHFPSPTTKTSLIELPKEIPDHDMVAKKKKKKKQGSNNSNNKNNEEEEDDDDDDDGVGNVKRSKGVKEKRQRLQEKKRKAKEAKEKKDKSKIGGEDSIVNDDNDDDDDDDDDEQGLENGFSLSDVDADDEEEANEDIDGEADSDEDDEDDDEELPGELAGLENGGVRLPEVKRHRSKKSKGRNRNFNTQSRMIQMTPFMPSSTPMTDKTNKKVRILVWNLIGAVLSFDENTHDVVEVEFSDSTKRSVGIKDHFGYTLGCLCENGVLLASPKTKDHGSLVTFRQFSSWALNSDWTQFMPEDEDISVVALGQRFAAVATKPNHMIRIFSLSGMQTYAYGVSGTVITATAMGDYLAVVYQSNNLSTALTVEILEINAIGEIENITYNGNIKVGGNGNVAETLSSSLSSSSSSLEWVGFTTDTNEFCTYDSKGWVWMLTDMNRTKRWVPMVQNAAKSADCDWFWAASVTSEQFIGAACLSNERYPSAKPRPGLRSIAISAPVIERTSKNGKPTVAERLARTRLKLQRLVNAKRLAEEMCDEEDLDHDEDVEEAEEAVARIELEADKCVLSLMEDACRRENNLRALDLTTRLNCKISFKYAVELAKHFKRTALVTRVEDVAKRKVAMINEELRVKERKLLMNHEVSAPPSDSTLANNVQQERTGNDHTESHAASGTVGTSPVSTPNGNHDMIDTSKSHRKMNTTAKGNDGGLDAMVELELTKRHEAKSGVHTRNKKTSSRPVLDVMDVTDDEEEEAVSTRKSRTTATTTTTTTTTAQTKKGESNRGTKRRVGDGAGAVVAGSQETVKETNNNSNVNKKMVEEVTKKARVTEQQATAPKPNPKFTSFRNRFLKK